MLGRFAIPLADSPQLWQAPIQLRQVSTNVSNVSKSPTEWTGDQICRFSKGQLISKQNCQAVMKHTQDTKGQIILKGLFSVLEFSQKRTKEFVVIVKMNSFVCFF